MTAALTAEVEIGDEVPTALYRLFAADGSLLYLGITGNLRVRFARHAQTRDWWHLVARKTVIWYGSRLDALKAEAVAIRDELPRQNIAAPEAVGVSRPLQGALDHVPSAVVLARLDAGLSMTELAQQLGVSLSLVSMIETGARNATPALLLRMADALNCPVVVLESKRQCVPASDANGSAA